MKYLFFILVILLVLVNNRNNLDSEENVYLQNDNICKSIFVENNQLNVDSLIDEEISAYIQRFLKIAKKEQEKYGIPVSITLSQAILESKYGKSKLAINSNNHFGIKYYNKRNIHAEISDFVLGYAIMHDDCKKDHVKLDNLSGIESDDFVIVSVKNNIICKNPDKFVKYDRSWASFRHHSLILLSDRYQIFGPNEDYRTWLYALKKGNYASDKNYCNKLEKIILELNLNRYDE